MTWVTCHAFDSTVDPRLMPELLNRKLEGRILKVEAITLFSGKNICFDFVSCFVVKDVWHQHCIALA